MPLLDRIPATKAILLSCRQPGHSEMLVLQHAKVGISISFASALYPHPNFAAPLALWMVKVLNPSAVPTRTLAHERNLVSRR